MDEQELDALTSPQVGATTRMGSTAHGVLSYLMQPLCAAPTFVPASGYYSTRSRAQRVSSSVEQSSITYQHIMAHGAPVPQQCILPSC